MYCASRSEDALTVLATIPQTDAESKGHAGGVLYGRDRWITEGCQG
jgi:hypothetical protein